MRHIVIASVGDGSTQIGYLQRRQVHLTLTNGDTDYGQSVPGTLVGLVVELCIRNQSSFLARQVDAQLVAESHAHHIVFPNGHRILHRTILALVSKHIVESPTEITVARSTDGIHQCDWRRVTVATYVQSPVRESVITWKGCARSDDTLGKISQCLSGLERRTRRILSHDASVEQRLPWVLREPSVHLASVLSHQFTRVVRWRGNHCQHRTVSRVDGHDTAYLSLQQPFAQSLQVHVDTQRQVFSCNRSLVEFSVLIASLYSSARITEQNLHTLHASKFLFVMLLNTQLSDVVARLVVVIFLDVAFRNLAHITQYMGCIRIGIFSHASLLHIEARESEHFFLEYAEVLVRQLRHEKLLRISGISRILTAVLDILHSLFKSLLGDAQRTAEVEGVESALLLLHHHHQVVGRLVIHHQLSVSIVDGTTRRELYLLQEGVTVGILLVILAHNLEREEPDDVDNHDSYRHTTNHITALLKIVIYHTLLYIYILYTPRSRYDFLKLSSAMISTMVMALLPPMHSSHCTQLKKLKVSSVKNNRL